MRESVVLLQLVLLNLFAGILARSRRLLVEDLHELRVDSLHALLSFIQLVHFLLHHPDFLFVDGLHLFKLILLGPKFLLHLKEDVHVFRLQLGVARALRLEGPGDPHAES